MQVEYRVSFDYETRKGVVTLYQDGVLKGEPEPIKHLHISQNRTVDYAKDEMGNIVDIKYVGPIMTSFTMTGSNE